MNLIKKIVVLLSVTLCLSAVSCGSAGKVETNCETGWAINKYETKDAVSGATEAESQFVCLQLTLSGEKAEEVWVNFGEMSVDETEILLNRYNYETYADYSTTTYKKSVKITKKQVNEAKKGWVRIADGYSFSSSYLKLSFYGGIKVDEIVILNGKGEKVKATVKAAKLILKDEKGTIYGKPYYTADEIKEMDLKEGSPLNLFDEQDKFDEK